MQSITMFAIDALRLRVISTSEMLLVSFLTLGAFIAYKAIYNRFFHPLSKYPGPFLGSYNIFLRAGRGGQNYRTLRVMGPDNDKSSPFT